jgi:hypothetical protein
LPHIVSFFSLQIYRRHELAGNFKPSAFREEAALMSEGENMYAFQICNIPMTDQKITHFEFLGCIAEDDEDEDDVAQEDEDNKRGELLHVLAVKADCIFCKI